MSPQHHILPVFLIFYLTSNTHALPTPLPHYHTNQPDERNPSCDSWSLEAILTLVGVFVTLLCFVVGMAWPSLQCVLRAQSGVFQAPYIVMCSLILRLVADTYARDSHTIADWRKRDLRELRRELQEKYDFLLEIRRGRY
jgi:hypothetical protein